MQQQEDYDLVIVGGGMVGLSLAAALLNTSLKIALVERQPLSQLTESINESPTCIEQFDLRVSAISPANQTWLKSLGCWQHIPRNRIADYQAMHVWDTDSSGAIHFEANEIAQPLLGSIVENQQIQRAILTLLHQSNQITFIEAELESLSLSDEGAEICLSNQDRLCCRLLIGADGARSRVRQLAAIESTEKPYQQTAIVANIRTQQPHQQTAWQRFSQSGPLALLPLPNANWCSIVWSQDTEKADTLMQLSDSEFGQRLTQAFDHRLGKLELSSQRAAFPLIKRHSQTYLAPGLALIGDAAHTIHPLAGQGVNIGFADAKMLAEQITSRWSHLQNPSDTRWLRPFERARKSENHLMQETMSGFKWLFAQQTPPFVLTRSFGMRWLNQFAPGKQLIMKKAMGL